MTEFCVTSDASVLAMRNGGSAKNGHRCHMVGHEHSGLKTAMGISCSNHATAHEEGALQRQCPQEANKSACAFVARLRNGPLRGNCSLPEWDLSQPVGSCCSQRIAPLVTTLGSQKSSSSHQPFLIVCFEQLDGRLS